MKKYKIDSGLKFQVNSWNQIRKVKTSYDEEWRNLDYIDVSFNSYTDFNRLPIWMEKIIEQLPYIWNEEDFRKEIKNIWKNWTVAIVIDCTDNHIYRFGMKEHALNEQEYYGKQKGLFRKKWRVSFPELTVEFLQSNE